MSPGIVVGLFVAALGGLAALMARENARRKAWFVAARAALGADWTEFAPPDDLTDGLESRGKVDGVAARLWADPSTTHVRLDVPLPEGVDGGQVYNFIVRDGGGSIETGREGIRLGFDDEAKTLVLRGPGHRHDAPASVRVLLEDSKAARAALPALLVKHAERRREVAGKTFGPHTGEDGRHTLLGLALDLPPEEWEVARVAQDGSLLWERFPPDGGDSLPCELRLSVEKQDAALSDAGARERLVARVAQARVASLPDGSFDGPAPEVHGETVEPVGAHPTARVVVEHAREVELDDGQAATRPYSTTVVAVFAPWAVAVLELAAPRADSSALLARLLRSVTLVEPKRG